MSSQAWTSQKFCRKCYFRQKFCKCHGMYFLLKSHEAHCESSNGRRVPRILGNSVMVESEEDEVVLVWVTSDAFKDKSNEGIISSQDTHEASSSQYFCRKCKCHGMYFSVKGHKPYCEYKNCECSNCSRVPRRSRKSFTVPPAVESEEDDVVVVGEVRNKSSEGQEVKQETTDTKQMPANSAESNRYSSLTMANENLVTTSTVSPARPPVTKRKLVPRQNAPVATRSEERQRILQQLRELHELKKCEALNVEEFEEKKRILLNDFR